MQESKGCVRVRTTSSPGAAVRNPGLMQSHNGPGSCSDQTSCPPSAIEQMIRDGAAGTPSGDGLKQWYDSVTGTMFPKSRLLTTKKPGGCARGRRGDSLQGSANVQFGEHRSVWPPGARRGHPLLRYVDPSTTLPALPHYSLLHSIGCCQSTDRLDGFSNEMFLGRFVDRIGRKAQRRR